MDRKHNVAYILSPLLSGGKIPGENPSEKPSLGSSRWDLNLWPLTPQSSALTTRPPTTANVLSLIVLLLLYRSQGVLISWMGLKCN